MAKRSIPFRTVKTPPMQTFKTDQAVATNFDYLTPKDWEDVFDDLPSTAPSTEETDSSSDSSFSDYYNDLFGRQSDFSNSPAEGWFEDFSRQSGQDFLSSGAQLITQNLQDVSQAFLNLTQQGLLSQVQEGNESITRPSPLTNDITGGLFQGTTEKYLDDLFGENDTISRDELLSNDLFYEVGIRLATTQQTAPSGDVTWVTTNQETIDSYVQLDKEYQQSLEEEGSLEADPDLMGTATVEETIGDEDFTTAPLPTPTPTDDKVEVDDIGGTELTEVDATAESTYTLPENEPVDVTKLPTEDQIAIWPQIQEALSKIPSTVGEILFGPDGMPTSVDEWIEWVDETLQAQMGPSNLPYPTLPFPIVITYDSDKGTWVDLKIPVSFDANGNPIRIPLFDADGNFVGGEAIGESVRGQVLGPLERVFIDEQGNLTIDLPKLGEQVLTDVRVTSDGKLTGTAATLGRVFFNTGTGEWEEEDEPPPETSTEAGETTPETTTDVEEAPPPKDLPIVGEDEEETPPPTKGGKVGGRVITDKEGNVVEINRPDVIVGNGGVSVLPGTTTVNEPVDNRLDDDIWNRGGGVGTTLEPAEVGEELILEEPVVGGPVIVEEDDDIWNRGPGVGTTLDPAEVGEELFEDPVVTTQDPVVTTEDPVVGGPVITEGVPEDPIVGGPVIVEQGPEDPLVGTDDPIVEDPLVGTLSGGGGGGGGGGLGSGGYMGGLSYGLPPFVGVQYQPKDYTAQLNRIINESLFKGMI